MATPQRVPIGARIRTERRTAGVTQRDLASAVGVSPAYLSLIESNKRQIGGRLLHQIAERLGVPADTFTAVSDDRLAAELNEVALTLDDAAPADAAQLVAFSPEWARIVLGLHARTVTAEARAHRLADRFAREPEWVSFAHDILSRITSIRAAAEILIDFGAADAGTRRRFTETVASESARLTDVARHLIEALRGGTAVDGAGADVREVDAFLEDNSNHFPRLETAAAAIREPLPDATHPTHRFEIAREIVERHAAEPIAAELARRRFRTPGAERRAAGALRRYAAGAFLMPYSPFLAAARQARYDLDELALRYRSSFEQVAHRLATLRRPGEEGLPFAFLRVDPAGAVSKRLSTPALRLPLFGACPLWAIYESFAQPGRTVSQLADLEGRRFLFVARALEKAPRRQAQPATRFAVMLGLEEERMGETVYGDAFASRRDSLVTFAGYECLSCRREGCAQRIHGSGGE